MRKVQLVSTADRVNGWCHSTITDHYNKTITISVYRVEKDGKIAHHPISGKKWKYGNTKNVDRAIDTIHDLTDKIGLKIGSLAEYKDRN